MSSSIRGFPFELQIMHRKDFLPPPKLRSHSDRPILHCCRSSSSQASLASRFEICFTADLQRLGYDHSTTILDHPRPSYFLLPPHLLTTLGEHVQSRAENGNAKLGHMTVSATSRPPPSTRSRKCPTCGMRTGCDRPASTRVRSSRRRCSRRT